jgi:hypothetical protein
MVVYAAPAEKYSQASSPPKVSARGHIIRVGMPLTIPRAILYGGLTAGMLDLIDAFVFFGVRNGVTPVAVLHSIAAGFVGREAARAGGTSTAMLGLASHFLVAFCIVSVYVLASRVMPALRKQWVLHGIAFGFVAYLVMTWFVVPMSNAGNRSISFALPVMPILINGLLIHALGVGVPAAFFSSRVRPDP